MSDDLLEEFLLDNRYARAASDALLAATDAHQDGREEWPWLMRAQTAATMALAFEEWRKVGPRRGE